MAIINLSNDKIQSLSSEIESLDSTLLNSYFPELKDKISQIKSNVLNDQVNQILVSISSQVDTISSELATDLPKLEQFLSSQMQQYAVSESEAEAKVNAVLQKMMAFSGVAGTADASSSANTNGATSESSSEGYSHGWGQKYAETWTSWWGDVKESYSDTHGLVSGVGNTVEAALDTAGALLETVGNGLSDGLHAVGNAVSWILG